MALKQDGHTVGTKTDTEGVEEYLQQDTPDLLILDVMFPDNSSAGLDAARRIRESKGLENLPIIMLSGVNQEFPMHFSDDAIDDDWMPVQRFVEKPVEMEKLFEAIRQLLDL